MATRATRKARSRETEKAVADHLTPIFPAAEAVASSLSGVDILHTPGLAVEVKARRDLNLPAWLRQAAKNSHGNLPCVVSRPDGFGVATIEQWPVILTFKDFTDLLIRAGYGGEEGAA